MTVLDWLAPEDKPFRKGVMIGFDARHTRGHVYRSILEAIALTMKNRVDAMCDELGISSGRIVVSGGGAGSDLFMRIFADVFGIPASRSVGSGGASLGGAICAAVATGVYPDFETAVAAMTKDRESFAPDPANADVYRATNETVYRTIRDATDGSSSAPTRSSTDSPGPEATASRQRIAIMDLSREGIVEGLQRIVEPGDVITDEKILVASSVDNFRKLQNIFDVHTMPVPAAIVMARSTEQVAAILRFADEHGVNVIPRTGGTATEGGLESAVPDSIIIDGSP
jgi:hypothetical protein